MTPTAAHLHSPVTREDAEGSDGSRTVDWTRGRQESGTLQWVQVHLQGPAHTWSARGGRASTGSCSSVVFDP